ncbi:PLD nuclease N-terminal domain-containing protein [Phycicoccus sp. SLBN-51]|jgi:hypothetical protein|uniref:PLD nuclease N-terminal domain-containing protein n=1 Tax=Phycicoccus sp. SLBN-51 TaxID=2768447 RepID=UPI001150F2A8|nr:PLD nuclease N-terminal domain-containing protein [Phycicoccus sp. SLBN-51]TQJ49662.1 phospholipase D-like protein [Phycicoccus sp. SLBN-51]
MARERRRWQDLSDNQRRMVVVGAVVQIGLEMVALRDLRRRPAEQVRGPKWAWVPAMSVNFIGPIAYFLVGRRRGAAAG